MQASSANTTKVLLMTTPTQQQEPDIKQEPHFIGPVPVVEPDPVDFDAFCTVEDLHTTCTNFETPRRPKKIVKSAPGISRQSLMMEMDFLRAEKIALQTRIHCLEEQVCF